MACGIIVLLVGWLLMAVRFAVTVWAGIVWVVFVVCCGAGGCADCTGWVWSGLVSSGVTVDDDSFCQCDGVSVSLSFSLCSAMSCSSSVMVNFYRTVHVTVRYFFVCVGVCGCVGCVLVCWCGLC